MASTTAPATPRKRRPQRRAAAVIATIRNAFAINPHANSRRVKAPPPNEVITVDDDANEEVEEVRSPPPRSRRKSTRTASSKRKAEVQVVPPPSKRGCCRSVTVTPSTSVVPDDCLHEPFASTASVAEVKGEAYSAVLSRASIATAQHEFVVLQVLMYQDAYYLWSRTGIVGQHSETNLEGPVSDPAEILQRFRDEFDVRAATTWANRHVRKFQRHRFSWVEIETESSSTNRSTRGHSQPNQTSTPSTTGVNEDQRTVLEFFRYLVNGKSTAPATTTPPVGGVNARYHLPAGRFSVETIRRGYEVLHELQDALTPCNITPFDLIIQLSEKFYSFIPHPFGLQTVDSMLYLGDLVAQMEEIGCHALPELHSYNFVKALRERNFLEEFYANFGCQLFPVAPGSEVYQDIEAYISNSSCCSGGWKVEIVNVFRVHKPDEDLRYEPFLSYSNRRILWHGSPVSNWLGILQKGLLIAPPGIPSNGASFGKGIYFTDRVSKALGYCRMAGYGADSKGVLLLSEVALGKTKHLNHADGHAGTSVKVSNNGQSQSKHQSCKCIGYCMPHEDGDRHDETGALWPLGHPKHDRSATASHRGLNEYVIYNVAQTRMRYVVVVQNQTSAY